MTVADPAELAQIVVGRACDAACCAHRINHDGGNPIGTNLENLLLDPACVRGVPRSAAESLRIDCPGLCRDGETVGKVDVVAH